MCGGDERQMTIQVLDMEGFKYVDLIPWAAKLEQAQKQTQEVTAIVKR